jgi:hypothetical protein
MYFLVSVMLSLLPKKPFFYLALSLIFSGCASVKEKKTWPAEIPPIHVYTDYYSQDVGHQTALTEQEYLLWVHRFYYGWALYNRGWLKATDELVATLKTENDKKDAKEKMLAIGKLVSPEWAKNKQYRVINSRHLGIWGNAINSSILAKEQMLMLDKILLDVQLLLEKRVEPNSIIEARYYLADSDDPFAAVD